MHLDPQVANHTLFMPESMLRLHTSIWDRILARWQSVIRKFVWGMDIHPSTQIALTALIDRTWPRGIHIGPHCLIEEHAVVLTHDMTRGVYLDTWIGARCRIGTRAIILPGLTIGEDCIVMPGALVTRNMPASSRALGNPAEIMQKAGAGDT